MSEPQCSLQFPLARADNYFMSKMLTHQLLLFFFLQQQQHLVALKKYYKFQSFEKLSAPQRLQIAVIVAESDIWKM